MVIIFPIVLLVSLAAVQAGLWMYARSLCLAAAQEGALVGATLGSSPAQAERAAVAFIEDAAPRFAQVPVVEVARGAEQVTVTVTARIPTVLPGFLDQVDQTAALPVERYT
jgi:Flp pilus assembly protein TadG